MKKVFALMLALPLMMGLSSCSSDDDDDKALIGKWEWVGTRGEVEANPKELKDKISNSIYTEPDRDHSEFYEFKKGGKGISTYIIIYNIDETREIVTDFTYTVKGNKLTITSYDEEDDEIEVEEIDFTLKDDLLVFIEDVKDEYDYQEKQYPEGKIIKALALQTYKRR